LKDDARRLLALSIFHCVNDGSLTLFASALPVMRVSLGLSLIQIGTVLSLGLVATMLLQLLFGSLSDRGHARMILLLGFAGIAVADLVFPVGSSFLQVLVMYVFLRSAAGVYHPVSFSSIGRTYAENKSKAFGYQGATGDLGLAIATLSTGILSQTWGWRVPFWVWGTIGVILFTYFAVTIIRYRIDFHPESAISTNESSAPGNRSARSTFASVATVYSITTTTFILFTGYMPLYFNIVEQFSPVDSAAAVALWVGIGVLAGLGTGRLVKRLSGEVRTLQAMFAVEVTLLLIANIPHPQTLSFLVWRMVRCAAIVTTGLPVFVTFPAANGLLGLRMPHRRLGLTYALSLSLSLMVSSLATYLTGYAAWIMTIGVMLPALLIIAVLGTITSFIL
jgi:FSR family fosmidomycin resistance protein-like MFS transporter